MDIKETVGKLRKAGKDNALIEVKATTNQVGKSVWDTVSAFSNTRGGTIILGLDEKSGFTTSSEFSSEKIINQIIAGTRGKDAKISPPPIISELDAVAFEGNEIVVFTVEELPAESKPCYVAAKGKLNGSYERLSDGDHRLGPHEVYLLANQAIVSREDQQPVDGATIDDLDEVLVQKLLDRIRIRRPRAVDGTKTNIEALRRLQVIATGSEHPTLAGLLALGKYPQQFFSQLMISFAHYPGTSKSDMANGSGFADVDVLEGSIPNMIDDAVNAVLRNLSHRKVIKGAGAEERPEIPVEAIRESIANAVTHRDYSAFAQGDQVRVELYSDRLEVHSTGGIWGRRIESISDGVSRSRNQVLSKLLTDVEFRNRQESVCENQGSGIPRMQGVMQQDGLPMPDFRSSASEFTVVLSRHGVLNPEIRQWLNSIPGDRSNLEDQILALVRHLGPVSTDHLRRQLGADTSEATSALKVLLEAELIQYDEKSETYMLFPEKTRELSELENLIIQQLDPHSPLKLAEIAQRIDKNPSSLRATMRRLVDDSLAIATAPPSSRNRAYLLGQGSGDI